MPTISDSHCHISRFRLPEAAIAAAAQANVARLLMPAVDENDFATLLALHHPPQRYAAIGIHPWFAHEKQFSQINQIDQILTQQPQLLIGETGLDYHPKHHANWPQQTALFAAHIQLAQRHQRPLIVHNVRASSAIVAACQQARYRQGGIVHAFSGSLEEANQLIKCGFFIGIGQLVLRENAVKTRRAAQILPLQHIVLETDAPFGHAHDDKASTILWQVAHTIAQLRQMPVTELIAACEDNLNHLLAFTTQQAT